MTHAVSECWQIAQFFLQQPRLRCMQNVRQSVLYAKARQGPGLPRYISVGVVYSALVCHVNRLGTELGTEPSIPTTRKDHSAAAIQRHTHPYTDLYTTDTKLLILLKTLRAGGSSWHYIHCTMRLPMSIDISEVLKCKQSFHANFK